MDEYDEFDAWCLCKGFDPLEVPAYRFYHAALAWLREGRLDEDLIKFENALRDADSIPHPFLSKTDLLSEIPTRQSAVSRVSVRELSLEEQKKKEFAERAKEDDSIKNKFRVPSWWLGEEEAYKTAKARSVETGSLPKFG